MHWTIEGNRNYTAPRWWEHWLAGEQWDCSHVSPFRAPVDDAQWVQDSQQRDSVAAGDWLRMLVGVGQGDSEEYSSKCWSPSWAGREWGLERQAVERSLSPWSGEVWEHEDAAWWTAKWMVETANILWLAGSMEQTRDIAQQSEVWKTLVAAVRGTSWAWRSDCHQTAKQKNLIPQTLSLQQQLDVASYESSKYSLNEYLNGVER
jgi:hypothetical protein